MPCARARSRSRRIAGTVSRAPGTERRPCGSTKSFCMSTMIRAVVPGRTWTRGSTVYGGTSSARSFLVRMFTRPSSTPRGEAAHRLLPRGDPSTLQRLSGRLGLQLRRDRRLGPRERLHFLGGGRRRRGHDRLLGRQRPAGDQRVQLFALEGLPLEQRLGDPVEDILVLGEHRPRASVALVDDPAHFLVDLVGDLLRVVPALHQIPAEEYRPVLGAERQRPSLSDIPNSVTILRASSVAFSKSLAAPVVISPNTISSATRPPRIAVMFARISLRVTVYFSSCGSGIVYPSAIPRGRIVTLCGGFACGTSLPSSACPPSW